MQKIFHITCTLLEQCGYHTCRQEYGEVLQYLGVSSVSSAVGNRK